MSSPTKNSHCINKKTAQNFAGRFKDREYETDQKCAAISSSAGGLFWGNQALQVSLKPESQ